jgi:hypothetical protein
MKRREVILEEWLASRFSATTGEIEIGGLVASSSVVPFAPSAARRVRSEGACQRN